MWKRQTIALAIFLYYLQEKQKKANEIDCTMEMFAVFNGRKS